jgi:hypothetical protein
MSLPDDLAQAARASLDTARERVAAAERALTRVPVVEPDPVDLLRRLDDWDQLSRPEQRDLLETAYVRVRLLGVGMGRRGAPMPERLIPEWHDDALSHRVPEPRRFPVSATPPRRPAGAPQP